MSMYMHKEEQHGWSHSTSNKKKQEVLDEQNDLSSEVGWSPPVPTTLSNIMYRTSVGGTRLSYTQVHDG